jgi:hypothetical protein
MKLATGHLKKSFLNAVFLFKKNFVCANFIADIIKKVLRP